MFNSIVVKTDTHIVIASSKNRHKFVSIPYILQVSDAGDLTTDKWWDEDDKPGCALGQCNNDINTAEQICINS